MKIDDLSFFTVFGQNNLNFYHLNILYLLYSYQVPYNVAFKNKTSEDVSLLVVDSIVDVIFFIDIGT